MIDDTRNINLQTRNLNDILDSHELQLNFQVEVLAFRRKHVLVICIKKLWALNPLSEIEIWCSFGFMLNQTLMCTLYNAYYLIPIAQS